MEMLKASATWQSKAHLPPYKAQYDALLQQTDQPFLIVDGTATDDPIPALERPTEAVNTLKATYKRPFQMHAALGPSAAVALLSGNKLTVWTHAQGVYPVRAAIAPILGMSEEDVRLIYTDGPGVYGQNGADDAALDAALLAQALPERPVSLQWTRADEHTWEPYTPAMVIRLQASLDGQGKVIDWNHDVWSPAHIGRSQPSDNDSSLIAAWHLSPPYSQPPSRPAGGSHSGGHRNADPLYTFERRRIVKHFLPNSLLRSSSMRGLGAYANIFAIESFMDELADAAGIDPVDFRLRHLADKRARAVIEAAAEKAGWRSDQIAGADGQGRGFAFAQYRNKQTYTAVVVDLSVDRNSGAIKLERAVIAADAGQIINPDGLSNQLEGGFVQSASWTLYEQVTFDERGISSTDWDSYPILRFSNAPAIETVLLNGPDLPHVGAGEASLGPTPAAIGNAIYRALGIRLRQVPFSPQRVLAALEDDF
jgi:CO/xanthine dehydrogenase Mo-binding subunit